MTKTSDITLADVIPTPYAVQPAFTPLKFGDIKPCGWILAQMERDLRTGFAGHLDEFCHEASSDIFVSGRNCPGELNSTNQVGSSWWNGETEGNWRSGQMMLACLTRDPAAVAKAKAYVEHILASQEADGYIGIFSPELRYKGDGELWTQTCLFRGLLAYAEATDDGMVFTAVKRAVDRTIEGYTGYEKLSLSWHDPLYTDVLESLFAKTGDKKYLEFGLRLFHDYPELENFLRQPEVGGKFQRCYADGHGASVAEAMRMPFWFGAATGDREYFDMGRGLIATMRRWTLPGGALVSEECVDSVPDPWNVGYEYCTIIERQCTLLKAGRQIGDASDFEAAEHLFLNAAQGTREPDGSAILYCSDENRLSIQDEHGKRQRFSPTHQQVAVCCNPNASRIAPYFIAGAWLQPSGTEPAIAATLYCPCQVETKIGGTAVHIREETNYPYSGEVVITLTPDKPAAFCLWLRNPSWSNDTKITCVDADIRRVGDFWQLRKTWNPGDTVAIRFDQVIREVPAVNGEVALQYGPLLYVLPVKSESKTVKTYPNSDLKDYYVIPDADVVTDLSLPGDKRDQGFGFVPENVAGTDLNFPLDNPPVVLKGALLSKDGSSNPVTLVPMGAKSAQLRRVTFPVTKIC